MINERQLINNVDGLTGILVCGSFFLVVDEKWFVELADYNLFLRIPP